MQEGIGDGEPLTPDFPKVLSPGAPSASGGHRGEGGEGGVNDADNAGGRSSLATPSVGDGVSGVVCAWPDGGTGHTSSLDCLQTAEQHHAAECTQDGHHAETTSFA